MNYETKWVSWDENRHKHVHVWSQATSIDAEVGPTICIIHGLGEHGGRYENLASDLVSAGFRVLAFDQQGHGLSKEPRGCIASYDAMLDDIRAFLTWVKREYRQPVVLFGHSMGGNLVLNYVMRREVLPAAVISSSPMIKAVRQPTGLLLTLGRLVMKLAPNYRLHSEVVAERLMSHPDEQQDFRDDELFHSQLSLRLGAALLDSGHWALTNAQQLAVPTLLTHGTQDALTRPEASRDFAERAGDVCRLEILHDSLHDPFRGLERIDVIKMFVEFANHHTSDAEH